MPPLSVQKIRVTSRRSGGNQAPGSGDVWFSDGKVYGWFRLPEGHIRFSAYRCRAHGGHEHFSFSSAPRAALVEAALNE